MANTRWTRDGVESTLNVDGQHRQYWRSDDALDRYMNGKRNRAWLKAEDMRKSISFDTLPRITTAFRAEDALLSEADLKTSLTERAEKDVSNFVQGMSRVFDSLIGGMQVGLIDWLADDVCRFCFWRTNVVDTTLSSKRHVGKKQRGSSHTETTDITRSIQRTFSKQLHLHDVVSAWKARTKDNMDGMPQEVNVAVSLAPTWIRNMLETVTGNEIYAEHNEAEIGQDIIWEHEQHVRTWQEQRRPVGWDNGWRHDPAVVIGPYVLMGW